MAKKNLVEAKITLDSKQYEKSLSNVSKKTDREIKNIQKDLGNVSKYTDNNAKKVEASNKRIELSNKNLAKSYGTLRASTVKDMEKIRSLSKKVSDEANKNNNNVNNSNLKLIKGTSKLRTSTEADLNKLRTSLNKLGDESNKSKNNVEKSFNSIGKAITKATSTVKSKVDDMNNKVKSVGTSIKSSLGNNKAISTLSNGISTASSTINKKLTDISNKAKKTGEALKKMGESAKKAGNDISKVGDTLTKNITTPMVASGAVAGKLANDFDYAFTTITTLVDMNEKELAEYEKTLQKTAVDSGTNITEFANAVYEAISASVDYKDAIGFVGEATKLAKGGFMETSEAVDVLTTIMNTYGDKAGDLTGIMDKLFATQKNGKTKINELGSALGEVIPNANALGVSFDDLLGAFAHLTQKGIKTAVAGTRIRSMLDELGKSGTKASDALKKKTGKSFQELMESGKSLDEVLQIVKDSAEKSGLALSDMFGSTEAAGAANTIMSDLEGFKTNVDAVKNSAGEAEKAYEKMTNTMKEKIKGAVVDIQSSMVDLGQKMEPLLDDIIEFAKKIPDMLDDIDFEAVILPFLEVLEDLIKGLGDLIDWFKSLDKDTQNFILKAVLLGAALGPVISAFGSIVSVGGGALLFLGAFGDKFEWVKKMGSGFFGFFKKGFGKLGGFIKGAFGKMAAAVIPFVLAHLPVILAIAAVIGIIVLLVKNWDKVKETAIKVCEAIKEKWNGFKDWFGGIFEGLGESIKGVWDWICDAFEVGLTFIGDLIGLAFDIITLPWQFIWQNFGDIIVEAFENVCLWVQEGFNKIIEFFTPFGEALHLAWTTACDYLKTGWENVSNWLVEKWNGFIETASSVFSTISDVISDIWSSITSYIQEKWNAFTSWWSSTTSSICESVKGYLQGVVDKISSGFSSAIETAKGIWDGLWTKVTGVIENIKSAVSGLVSKLKGAFNFKWSLPRPRIPQIVTTGSWSWNPPSAPRFEVVWKHDGGIFAHPTVFGNIGVGDGFKGLGAQKEAIMPIEKLPDLLGLNERQGGDFKLNIEHFENNREQDIEQLVKEIGYFARKRGLNFGL